MMATTHVFTGIAMAAALATIVPELAPVIVLAAIIGGFLPDLDLYAGHRKTLHFPVYFSLSALATGLVALAVPTATTVGLAVFFLSAAMHSVMDVFGSGLEFKPWLGTSQRAVYDHYHGRWIRPRRWIRYDGAPEDFLLGAMLALPGIVIFDGIVRYLILVCLSISFVYTVLRKPLVVLAEWVLAWAPAEFVERVPDRFLPVEEEEFQRLRSH